AETAFAMLWAFEASTDTASNRVLIAETFSEILATSDTSDVWLADTAAAAADAALAIDWALEARTETASSRVEMAERLTEILPTSETRDASAALTAFAIEMADRAAALTVATRLRRAETVNERDA